MPAGWRLRAVLFLLCAGVAAASTALGQQAGGPAVPTPASGDRETFVAEMASRHGEGAGTAGARFDLMQRLVRQGQLYGDRAVAAMLLTPRHDFVPPGSRGDAYRDSPLPIGFGQTISAPHMVARMTSVLAVQPGQRVLEIGTGSGYQAAVLAHITDQVYSIEIVPPLAARTADAFARMAAAGYGAYAGIHLATGDGYDGWPEHAPYDRIIVTAAIDHIPPPLLQQLAPDGIMVIPVGPPTVQILLEVCKRVAADGTVSVQRRDVYEGMGQVRFVPFTRAQ